MHGDKPYYENKYREVGDKCYHIGYSSYYLDVALEYRKKYFEVVERESDWIPCSERIPEEPKENPVFDGNDIFVSFDSIYWICCGTLADEEKEEIKCKLKEDGRDEE